MTFYGKGNLITHSPVDTGSNLTGNESSVVPAKSIFPERKQAWTSRSGDSIFCNMRAPLFFPEGFVYLMLLYFPRNV